MDDLSVMNSRYQSSGNDCLDLSFVTETLKRKLELSEDHNSQLIEEKIKLSHQLGIQTQVRVFFLNIL